LFQTVANEIILSGPAIRIHRAPILRLLKTSGTGVDPILGRLIQVFVSRQLGRYPLQAFGYYCSTLISDDLYIYPRYRLPHLERAIPALLAQSRHTLATNKLRGLFLQLLDQDPAEMGLLFSGKHPVDRQKALVILIRIVLAVHWNQNVADSPAKGLLTEWLNILNERLPEFVPLPESPPEEETIVFERKLKFVRLLAPTRSSVQTYRESIVDLMECIKTAVDDQFWASEGSDASLDVAIPNTFDRLTQARKYRVH